MDSSRDFKIKLDNLRNAVLTSQAPDIELGGGQDHNATSSALLEQLVYIDNFMATNSGNTSDMTPNLDMDGQLSLDLAAFADDSFIFPDEDKKPATPFDEARPGNSSRDDGGGREPFAGDFPDANNLNIANLPRWPVPAGAKTSLESAGLSQSQISLLSALVAQHQQNMPGEGRGQESGPETNQSHDFLDYETSAAAVAADDVADVADGADGTDSELDKRRRNTAASARFRIKKKMKEKQMETKIANLNKLIRGFESKTQQLEMENKLLKNLIIEKGTQKSEHELKMLREKARQ